MEENKKYRIVNNFTDIETNEQYTTEHAPVEFSEKRVAEIEKVSKVIGYKLIEEILPMPTTNNSENEDESFENSADKNNEIKSLNESTNKKSLGTLDKLKNKVKEN